MTRRLGNPPAVHGAWRYLPPPRHLRQSAGACGSSGRLPALRPRLRPGLAAAPYDRFVDLRLEAAAAQRTVVAGCWWPPAAPWQRRRRAGRARPGGHRLRPLPRDGGRGRDEASIGLMVGDLRAVPVRDGWADLVLLSTPASTTCSSRPRWWPPWGTWAAAAPGGTVVVEPLRGRYVHDGWRPGRHPDPRRPAPGRHLRGRGRPADGAAAPVAREREESETYRQRSTPTPSSRRWSRRPGLPGRAPADVAGHPGRAGPGAVLWVTRPVC